jgi:hypothetical protein
MLTAAGLGVGLLRRDRAKDIEVYAHYRHEGGVDYQVDWQLSWFVERFPDQADHRRDSLDEYDKYIAMDGGVRAIEPEIWPC